MPHKKGFTLLEILLVVGIISILAGIVIIAINPGRQLATVRNTERKSDLKQIYNAMTQYYIDNGEYPATIPTTLTEICDTGTATTSLTCGSLINLTALVPTYITAIPTDPSGASSTLTLITPAYAAIGGTGYKLGLSSSTNGKLIATAPLAEVGEFIALGTTLASSTPATTYTVTYDGNTNTGGTAPTDSSTYIAGATVTVVADAGTLEKTGYTFAGWNTAANGSGTNQATSSTFVMGAGNVTLYAVWVSSIPADGLLAHWSFDNGFYSNYIVDDSDAGFSTFGTWSVDPATVYSVHSNCHYVTPLGVGNNSASWSFTPTVSGQYKVYSYWYAHPTRGTNIPHSIFSDSGTTTVLVNQYAVSPSASSTLLGIFNFTAGNSYSVTISDNAIGGSYVIADTIDWILASQPNTDSIIIDNFGSNNGNCAVINCPSVYDMGLLGKAFKFIGTEYINLPTMNVGTSYSTSVWFKLDSFSSGQNIIGSPLATGGFDYMGGFYADNKIYMHTNDNNYVSVPWTFDNNWHHLVITRNSTAVKFYLDGSQLGTTQTLVTNPAGIFGMIGGWGYNLGGNFFKGNLDEVLIYNRELSSSEVTTIYNSERP